MLNKNIIVVTGGAGFVGSNLIKGLLNYKNFRIISIDDYSSGFKQNHIKNKKVQYFKNNTKNISKILNIYRKKINCIFHFGEFPRIYQSFIKFDECLNSNILGTKAVINFCLKNKIKLIYSATSATLGNNGKDKYLSPYALTKANNLELLENIKKWFNFKYEVIYFYNVYGQNQISKGDMSTVIGIFENQYKQKKPLTVVKPGTQSRRFTHVDDTIKVCIEAWKKNSCKHYSISAKENYSILDITRMFGGKIKFLPPRLGERYKSSLVEKNMSNKILKRTGSIKIKDYILQFKKRQIKQ